MMDQLDEKLIRLLHKNAWQSSDALAKQLGVSASTVRRRINKLMSSETLRIVGLVNPAKAGYPLIVGIDFQVEHAMVDKVAQLLAKQPEIMFLTITTGRFDLLATAIFRSTEELTDFIQKKLPSFQGITHSETSIFLDVKKGRYFSI
jgi:Lrp/AsnC family transcriptional regulator for asnA, asnC and gidA